MTYRATPITQQDGSAQANSNCRLASAATGLDYDTLGAKTSTGAKMRNYSGDPEGGTSSDDAVRAWKHYSETLHVHDGEPFSNLLDALREGRLVHIDVWSATCGGPCCKSACGHTMAIAPEQNSDGKWLVADPWCKPAKWVWWSESKLRAGAEEWADRCGYRSAQAGGPRDIRDMTPAARRRIMREMFSRWTPVRPLDSRDDDYPGFSDTTGAAPCAWTATQAHTTDRSSDMAIKVPDQTKSYHLHLPADADFYRDSGLSDRLGELSSARDVPYVGVVIDGDSRAVILNTSKPYSDGVDRDTIVYVQDKYDPIED